MAQEIHPTDTGEEQTRCCVCHSHDAVQTYTTAINRDDIQELVGEYKRRIGKLIFDSYQALVETVKIWNNEEKRQEVCRYIKETAGQYPNHRGMKKKLMDLMPETPFEGEPMTVTREPNDMEKSLL